MKNKVGYYQVTDHFMNASNSLVSLVELLPASKTDQLINIIKQVNTLHVETKQFFIKQIIKEKSK